MKANFLVLTFLCLVFSVRAQVLPATHDSTTTIVSISTHLRSTGKVAIYQDERLEALTSYHPKAYYANARKGKGSDMIITKGFRIRAFSGNNQTTSKNRVYKIEKDLKEYMPDLATYVIFKSPNWRLHLGNFTSKEEAIAVMRDLKKSFPEYGREMFVVEEEIEIAR